MTFLSKTFKKNVVVVVVVGFLEENDRSAVRKHYDNNAKEK